MTVQRQADNPTKPAPALEESEEIKRQLLSVISHELRTPISIILGHVELLIDGAFGAVNDKQRGSLMTVRSSGASLLRHVENALEVSQLEGGNLPVYPDRFVMDHVRGAVMEVLGDEARRKGLEIRWETDPNAPPLFTDLGKITKVFRNLLDNAIKFTDKGGVAVRLSFLAEEQRLQCEVEDTGIGIPPLQSQVIFDSFRQVDGSSTRLYGGMGLGLRYVKKALELIGGGVEVESSVGKGSLFRFWFPVQWKRPA